MSVLKIGTAQLLLYIYEINCKCQLLEAVVRRCSVKKVFLKILQNSQENTSASLFFNEVAGLSLTL